MNESQTNSWPTERRLRVWVGCSLVLAIALILGVSKWVESEPKNLSTPVFLFFALIIANAFVSVMVSMGFKAFRPAGSDSLLKKGLSWYGRFILAMMVLAVIYTFGAFLVAPFLHRATH